MAYGYFLPKLQGGAPWARWRGRARGYLREKLDQGMRVKEKAHTCRAPHIFPC